jgi:hypothetical protein
MALSPDPCTLWYEGLLNFSYIKNAIQHPGGSFPNNLAFQLPMLMQIGRSGPHGSAIRRSDELVRCFKELS